MPGGRKVNERLIYEWLREDLKGQDWELAEKSTDSGPFVTAAAWFDGNGIHTPSLPPLDMNTWHGEVVPKLLSEGAEVHFVTNQNNHLERHHNIYARGCSEPFSGPDPWQSLTEYLEEK
jgi:hypothetical protein